MNVQSFLDHHRLTAHPFDAEEARLDPIFDRLISQRITHPAFGKILGRIDQPATSIVFGEKGSGKTAIRLMISEAIRKHNENHENNRVLSVAYDDLNPLLDALLRKNKQNTGAVLDGFRLEEHQDAILSLAVTKLVDALLAEDASATSADLDTVPLPPEINKRIKKMPKQKRRDLAVLAALYDLPRSGDVTERFGRLRKKLRLGVQVPPAAFRHLATMLTAATAVLAIVWYFLSEDSRPIWLLPALAIFIAGAALSWAWWIVQGLGLWKRCRAVARAMPGVGRSVSDLRQILGQIDTGELARQPLPIPDAAEQALRDSRYQLTRRFVDVLSELGFAGLIVLVDRVDEPTAISGDPDRMRSVVWPMFDNKFLKQERIGLKLLLPIELGHLLKKESATFFQEARLDKQNMVDRLEWSGTTLFDLCNKRIEACRSTAAHSGEGDTTSGGGLMSLFAEDVSRDVVVDSLAQMQQPRDAFKFLHQVIQEHCQITGEDQANHRIPRLTLEAVRRSQSQRVQDLHRGIGPA